MRLVTSVVLFVGAVTAIIESIDPSCGVNDIALIISGINEAIAAAADARAQLLTFNPYASSLADPRTALWNPLFNPWDYPTVLGYLQDIVNIRTNTIRMRFYCTGHTTHIKWLRNLAEPVSFWYDTDFYHNTAPYDHRSVVVGRSAGAKPLSSWTKHGYRSGDHFDCSGQAHIMLNENHIRGIRPASDTRSLALIRSNGILPTGIYNNLDNIRPLSRTILHEVPFFNSFDARVMLTLQYSFFTPWEDVVTLTDTPVDPTNVPVVTDVLIPGTTRTYGLFLGCISQRNAAIPTVRQAECLATLTVGLYLDQIQGRQAFWSLGVVDRDTLRPVNVPAAAGSTRLKHRALRTYPEIGLGESLIV